MKRKWVKMASWIIALALIIMGGIAMAEELITPETLLSACGMQEDDVDSSTLEEFIQRFKVTPESIEGAPADELRAELESLLASGFQNDYSYLFRSTEADMNFAALSAGEIERVAVYTAVETVRETALIDFKSGTIYADMGNFFIEDITRAEISRPVESDTETAVLNALAAADWITPVADADNEDILGVIDYGIAIETAKGVKHYVFNSRTDNGQWKAIHEIIVTAAGDQY